MVAVVKRDNFDISQFRSIDEVQKFTSWYVNSKQGEKYVYYSGGHLNSSTRSWTIKQVAWQYALRGWGLLFQKKLGIGEFEYIFIKYRCKKQSRLIPLNYYYRYDGKPTTDEKLDEKVENGKEIN